MLLDHLRRLTAVNTKLTRIQVMIEAALAQQGFMCAALNDLAVIDDQNLVGIADGAQAVGDDEAGAPLHQVQHRRLNMLLRARVHTAGGLIQNQNGGVGQNGAGNSQQLPLPLAQIAAPLRQRCLVALRQAMDELIGVRQPRRRHHFLIAGLQTAVSNIVPNRAAKQHRLLQRHTNLPPQSRLVNLANEESN